VSYQEQESVYVQSQFQKVPIRPVECLREAMDLVGDQYWLFVGICAVGLLIGSAAPMAILLGPMMCGMYLCYLKRGRGERASFEMLFKGFDYFVESLIVTLVMVAAMMVLVMPIMAMFFVAFMGMGVAGQAGNQGPAVVMLMGILGFTYVGLFLASILIGMFFMFAYLLIVDRGLKAIPAVKASAAAVLANFGGLLCLTLLTGLLGFAAALLCYLPIFLVLPITFGATVVAYQKVFPLQEPT